jgi:glutathione S-transferase
MTEAITPLTLYGSSISYFTGKLENYFRIKGIPYHLQSMTQEYRKLVGDNTGSTQMPALQLADGRWMSDSTPIIQWFEEQYPDTPVIPADPLQRFFSLLLEDYADEWLWRPAMHYRWYYPEGALWASSHLAEELLQDMIAPAFLKRWRLISRQRGGYTMGDGITPSQVPGVEAIYHRTLEQLQAILSRRPFLLGTKPSLADIGFSGPFFRHFGLDPVPAEIMRQQAPAAWEWLARMWNTRLEACPGELVDGIPGDWGPILDEIGGHYLPYLCANVDAMLAGKQRFDAGIGGVQYRGARASRYRLWVLKRLREHFDDLGAEAADAARALLEQHRCWEPLWRHKQLPIDDEFCSRLPFYADAKMTDVNERQ